MRRAPLLLAVLLLPMAAPAYALTLTPDPLAVSAHDIEATIDLVGDASIGVGDLPAGAVFLGGSAPTAGVEEFFLFRISVAEGSTVESVAFSTFGPAVVARIGWIPGPDVDIDGAALFGSQVLFQLQVGLGASSDVLFVSWPTGSGDSADLEVGEMIDAALAGSFGIENGEFTAAAVPEPAPFWLIACAAFGWTMRRSHGAPRS